MIFFFKKYKLEVFIFTLALVVRLAYLGFSVQAWGGDFNGAIEGADYYFQISQNILAGHGFSINWEPPYELNTFRTPVMPYFIVAAHQALGGFGAAILLQILLASLIPLLAMRIARYITDIPWIVIFVGIFMALEPYAVLFSTVFYSETIFTILLCISIIYFFRYATDRRLIDLFFCASFMSFAMLTKPTVEFLPLFLGAYLLWLWRSNFTYGLARVTLFIVLCVLMVSPWLYRNYSVAGSVALSPQAGVQLYTVLWPSVLSIKNGTTWGQEFDALIASGVHGPNNASVTDSSAYAKLAIPLLLQNPLPLTIVSINTTIGFFTHDGIYDVLRHLKIRPDKGLGGPALFVALEDPKAFLGMIVHFIQTPFALILIARIGWIALTGLCIYGAIRYLLREKKTTGVAAIIIVIYFLLTTLVIGLAVNARYRLPVNVFIVTFAAYAITPLVAKIRSRHDV